MKRIFHFYGTIIAVLGATILLHSVINLLFYFYDFSIAEHALNTIIGALCLLLATLLNQREYGIKKK